MAVRLLNGDVSGLCLGKPELVAWVAESASISDAVATLRSSGDGYVSVWVCGEECADGRLRCRCIGKFSFADVILFLCRDENLADPFKALECPVSYLLPEEVPLVRHLEHDSSLWEAIDFIIEGTQNIVIPITNHKITNSRKKLLNRQQQPLDCAQHNGQAYCWLTQEDIVRFIFNSVGVFSPIPTQSIEFLNVIDSNIMVMLYDEPASSALGYFHSSLIEQKPVAVVDEQNRLIGEISPISLACCDETAAAAITALTAVDLMAYIDYGGPPLDLIQSVKAKLKERNLVGMVELLDELCHPSRSSSSSSSSDGESMSTRSALLGRNRHSPARKSEAIVCSPGSSLIAVMIQALTNRVSSVWVVEEDQTVVGIVTFAEILKVLCCDTSGSDM